MAFGTDVGAFAQGLLGGMNAVSAMRERGARAAIYEEQAIQHRDRREAAAEARAAVERQGGGQTPPQAIPVPVAASTEAIAGGVPAPPRAQATNPMAVDDSKPKPARRYAEGGVVRAIPEEVTPESNPAPPEVKPQEEGGDRDPIRGALAYMRQQFGLDSAPATAPQGAIPAPEAAPASAGNTAGVAALLKGAGAESNETVAAARQRVDPEGRLPLGRANAILLQEMSAAFYKRGLIEEGDRASASLLQNYRRNMSMYGAFAVQAAESGNMEQAAKLLERAYDYLPDGKDVTIQPTQGGLQVNTGSGQPMVLNGPEAIRNAVGYAMDFDNWAKHLLSERKVNIDERQGDERLAETSRHNRATEGLSAASLAESRASRAEARGLRLRAEERELQAEASFGQVRAAQVEVRRAERSLEELGDDAPAAERQRLREKVREARDRADDLEARLPPRAAGALSQIEGRDAAIDDRRRNTDSQVAAREAQRQMTELKSRLAETRDPLERRKIEAQIGALDRSPGGRGRTAGEPRQLTFSDRAKIEEFTEELGGDLTAEAKQDVMPIAQGLATLNQGIGPREAASVAVNIRQGKFKAGGDADNPTVVIGTKAYAIPPGMTAALGAFYRQSNPAPVERTSRPTRPLPTTGQTLPSGMRGPTPPAAAREDIDRYLRR